MSPVWATPSPTPPSKMSPVESFARLPSVLMLVPWKMLLLLAEKPRPKPPIMPATKAWVTSDPSRDTTLPRTPVLPANAMNPLTSDTA